MSAKSFTEPLNSAPSYFECPTCGFLSDDPLFEKPDATCPTCGATGQMRRAFPTERLRRLDTRIRAYHDDDEAEIVVILVTAFLEAILEDIIDRILIAHGGDLSIRRLVLDSQRGIGARLGRVFPQLTGDTFEDVAANLGFEDFGPMWRTMRKARNAFIHDSPFHGPRESLDSGMAESAMQLLDQTYRLFALVNNRFVAEHRAGIDPHGT